MPFGCGCFVLTFSDGLINNDPGQFNREAVLKALAFLSAFFIILLLFSLRDNYLLSLRQYSLTQTGAMCLSKVIYMEKTLLYWIYMPHLIHHQTFYYARLTSSYTSSNIIFGGDWNYILNRTLNRSPQAKCLVLKPLLR